MCLALRERRRGGAGRWRGRDSRLMRSAGAAEAEVDAVVMVVETVESV